MALILSLNTAFETASVMLSADEKIIEALKHPSQKDHASFLEAAIKKIFEKTGFTMHQLDAIAVMNGPGSYTGLRVGLSSAKALCYALQKPLLLINTLDVIAMALKLQSPAEIENFIIYPMIDARRMEVFSAAYDQDLNIIEPYNYNIIDKVFIEEHINKEKLYLVGGSGASKLVKEINTGNIIYINDLDISQPFINLAQKSFSEGFFADIAYCEPFYLKPVYFNK